MVGWTAIGFGLLAGRGAIAEFDAEKYLIYGFGELSLRPRLEVSETYDSNLFYAEKDEVSDLVSRVRPGFSLVYGRTGDEWLTALSYNADVVVYADRHDLDYVGHMVSHTTDIKLARAVIAGRDNFSTARTTLGGTFAYLKAPVGVMSLQDDWRIDYDISPKTTVGANLEFGWTDYDASDLGGVQIYDYMSVAGSVRAGYIPSDKIVVYPQFTYSETYLTSNRSGVGDPPDLTAYAVSLGAEGNFTPKLSGTVSGGYEIREYADGSDIPDGWVSRVSLTWRPRAKTTVTATYRHWIQAARDSQRTTYTSDRPSIGVLQELGTQGRWTVGVDGYIESHQYPDGFLLASGVIDRADDLAGASIRSTYRWAAWLRLMASYDFSVYSDNVQGIPDYEVHRLTLRLVAGY